MNANDLGAYYLDSQGNVWQFICYAAEPTATLRRVDDHSQRRGGVVGAPIFSEFVRLRPERES